VLLVVVIDVLGTQFKKPQEKAVATSPPVILSSRPICPRRQPIAHTLTGRQ
jgi:hypothetical protein